MKAKKIFIFDKSETASALAQVMSMHGFEVITSDTPREAYRMIINFHPQLVLAEYLDVDGEWLCRQLRQARNLNDIQIIMMSAKGASIKERDLRSLLLSFGANGCLIKPFNYHEIPDYFDSWMQGN